MADFEKDQRALVDALEEPALVVEGLTVSVANPAARNLLGQAIEGRDVRFAIRQPELLEHVLLGRDAVVEVSDVGDFGRPWRIAIRALGLGTIFVRLTDRSEHAAAERMRTDFVANASHELRTPLSAVLGYAETLADDPTLPPETIANFGMTVRDEARRMLRIVEDLMSLSRIEADRFVMPAEEVDLADAVKNAIANASAARRDKRCEIKLEAPGELPAVVGDRAQIVQLFDNLISNALRYGCEEPSACVDIAMRPNGQMLETSVIDHGPGIPRVHLPRITERFYRVDEARSRASGGTGLGLAIVKHIVERHRGTIAIQSTLGKGTEVKIGLPIVQHRLSQK